MKIAVCQYDAAWEDKEENKARIEKLLAECPDRREIDWLIFPEMTLTGFTMDRAAAELTDADKSFFTGLAAENDFNVSYGGVEKGFNNLITLDRGGKRINTYSKTHLFSYGGEDKHYKAGSGPEAFMVDGLRAAPAVCFDLRFPYLFWNLAEKADIYVVIAAWPGKRAGHWMALLRARAIENQAFCVGVNRVGREGKIEYSGNSMCFDPLGNTVIDAGTKEGIFVSASRVNGEAVAKVRGKMPFLKERKAPAWTDK
jgi:predicted amidohydrolase